MHPHIPMVESLHGSCKKTALVVQPIPTRCPLQQTHTHIESRTHDSLPRKLTDIPISSHQTRRANDLHNQALRLSHGDDHGPKPTWWHTPSRSNAGTSTIRAENSAGRFTSILHVDRLDKFAIITALDKPDPKLASNTSRLVPDAKVVVSRSLKRNNTFPSDVSNLEKKNLDLLEDQLSKMPKIQCEARQNHLRIHFSWSTCTVPFGPDDGVVELQVPASRVGHQEYGGKQAPDWRLIGANCKPNSWDTPIRQQSLLGLTRRIFMTTLLPNSTIFTSQFFPVTPVKLVQDVSSVPNEPRGGESRRPSH